jgi:hypothetical protein
LEVAATVFLSGSDTERVLATPFSLSAAAASSPDSELLWCLYALAQVLHSASPVPPSAVHVVNALTAAALSSSSASSTGPSAVGESKDVKAEKDTKHVVAEQPSAASASASSASTSSASSGSSSSGAQPENTAQSVPVPILKLRLKGRPIWNEAWLKFMSVLRQLVAAASSSSSSSSSSNSAMPDSATLAPSATASSASSAASAAASTDSAQQSTEAPAAKRRRVEPDSSSAAPTPSAPPAQDFQVYRDAVVTWLGKGLPSEPMPWLVYLAGFILHDLLLP